MTFFDRVLNIQREPKKNQQFLSVTVASTVAHNFSFFAGMAPQTPQSHLTIYSHFNSTKMFA